MDIFNYNGDNDSNVNNGTNSDGQSQNSYDNGNYPPPQNGYGNGNYPPPQNGYGNGNYPPPQNGYGNGNYPPPQNGYGNGNYPPPQNGYGNGSYPPPNGYGYGNYPPPNGWNNGGYRNMGEWGDDQAALRKNNVGLAVAAFCIAMANVVIFGTMLSFISVPLALIFSIISLKKRAGGKGLAIASIVISAISALIFGLVVALIVKVVPEVDYYNKHEQQIMLQYGTTHTLPDRLENLDDYEEILFWATVGYDDIEDAYAHYVSEHGIPRGEIYSDKEDSDYKELPDTFDDDDGEELVDFG